jgi:hypothetical protein
MTENKKIHDELQQQIDAKISLFALNQVEAELALAKNQDFRQLIAYLYDNYLHVIKLAPEIEIKENMSWEYKFMLEAGPKLKDASLKKIVEIQTTKENMEDYIKSFGPIQRYKPWHASKTTMILSIAFLIKNNPDVCVVYQDKSCLDTGRECDMVWDDEKTELIIDDIFDKNFMGCLQNNNKKFVIMQLTLIGKNWAHANFIIIKKQLGMKPIAQHFEPHGKMMKDTRGYSKMEYDLAQYFRRFGILYANPSMMCPYGLQKIECGYKDRRCKDVRNDPGGYCAAWTFFFLQTALQFPDLWTSDITQLVAEVLNKDPKQFHKFIVNYSQFLYKNIELLILEERVRETGEEVPSKRKALFFPIQQRNLAERFIESHSVKKPRSS